MQKTIVMKIKRLPLALGHRQAVGGVGVIYVRNVASRKRRIKLYDSWA